ncbi:hypothetical protein QNI16_09495 [Cytophagaceae bacterium YF14B1]|uniref:Uncharacterized protein n=1 Tax=Xanthocytophaga flava TaxID=3048013 RepID=A0AAE3QJV8_9BACT|nr:hypothetical protein [Xanthocytophaga flavus]MDJ1480717.1 hypothetical protein [Xanthocytophaga flavus]
MKLEPYIINYPSSGINEFDSMNAIWHDEHLSKSQKLDLSFQLFEIQSTYAVLMHLKWYYNDLELEERDIFWNRCINCLLGSDQQQKSGIEYLLAVDLFEDDETVAESWQRLMELNNEKIVETLLRSSVAVPFTWKEELYYLLIKDKKWHYLLFTSLHDSFYGAFGDIDILKARTILERLKVDTTTKYYKNLQRDLFAYSSHAEYKKDANSKIASRKLIR